VIITSATNPRIKRLVALRDRRDRDREGVFVVEGMRALDRLLAAGRAVQELYVQPDALDDSAMTVVEELYRSGVEIVELSGYAMEKASYRDSPEGILAVCPQWQMALSDVVLSAVPLVLIVEGVEKPGNLGAVLRTADATGCDCVVVCDQVVDVFNPNVIRAATAVVFSMPVVAASYADVLAWVRMNGLQTVATTPETETLHWDVDLRLPTAILMGAEDVGLTQAWIDAADVRAKLPMAGQADSLNVSVATAVVLYEAVRQRAISLGTS
jgi:RNA methyltransferase, TrmH family